MTDQEINAAIAETCGWKYYDGWHHPDGRDKLPDYCNDLNAMHKAEGVLTKEQAYEYIAVLFDSTYEATLATARQRAEAFLRMLGKWKDESKMIELSKEQQELYAKLDAWEKCADNLVEYAREFTSHLSAWGKGYGRYDREIREAEESIATYNKLKNEKGE